MKNNEEKNWPKLMALGAGYGTIFIVLFGFGAVSGLTEMFGLDPFMQVESTFDLIASSWRAYFQIFEIMPNIDTMFTKILMATLPMYFPIITSIALILFIKKFRQQISNKIETIKTRHEKNYKEHKEIVKFAGISLSAPLLSTVGIIIIWVTPLLALSVPTLIGNNLARRHAIEHIIKPKDCYPTENRISFLERESQAKNKNIERYNFATCIVISSFDKNNYFETYGRLVLSTTKYATLYHPETGKSERYNLENFVISSSATDMQPIENAKLDTK